MTSTGDVSFMGHEEIDREEKTGKVRGKREEENREGKADPTHKESGTRRIAEEGTVKKPGDGTTPELTTFENLLEVVGTKGRWNILIFLICALTAFVSPLQAFSYQFLGATPDHWCLVPELQAANWSQHQVLTLAIPYSNDTESYESCQMYDYNYEAAVEMGYDAALANRSALYTGTESWVQCTARDFNFSQYQSTVVTEWDLVCERRPLYSTTQSVIGIGKMVGVILFGYLIDAWGRRPVVLLTSGFYTLTNFVAIASPSVEVYIVIKLFISFLESGQYMALFIIAMETCAAKYRAAAGALFVIPWALGYMAVPSIAYLIRDWQWLQLAYAIPTLHGFIYFIWLPESPRWLVMQGRFQEAHKVLISAARVNNRSLPSDDLLLTAMANIYKQADLGETPKEVEPERRAGCSCMWKQVLATLKHLVILLATPQLRLQTLVLYFCWFAVSIVYYGVALNATNLGTDPYLYVFLGGVLEVPSYLLLWAALVYVGRRKSMVTLFMVAGICIYCVMVIILVAPDDPGWARVALSQAGKVAVTAAFQLIWTYTTELYPTNLRSLACGEAGFFSRFGSFCAPYVNDLLGVVAVWLPSALFGSVSVVAAVLTFLLPETRHADLPETPYLNNNINNRKNKNNTTTTNNNTSTSTTNNSTTTTTTNNNNTLPGRGMEEDTHQEREATESRTNGETPRLNYINLETDNPAFVQ